MLFRLAVPDRAAGWLAVRTRRLDAGVLGLLGALLVISSVWLLLMG